METSFTRILQLDRGIRQKIGPFSFTKKFVRSPRYDLHFFVRKKARFFRLASAALPPQVPGALRPAGPRAQLGNPG